MTDGHISDWRAHDTSNVLQCWTQRCKDNDQSSLMINACKSGGVGCADIDFCFPEICFQTRLLLYANLYYLGSWWDYLKTYKVVLVHWMHWWCMLMMHSLINKAAWASVCWVLMYDSTLLIAWRASVGNSKLRRRSSSINGSREAWWLLANMWLDRSKLVGISCQIRMLPQPPLMPSYLILSAVRLQIDPWIPGWKKNMVIEISNWTGD